MPVLTQARGLGDHGSQAPMQTERGSAIGRTHEMGTKGGPETDFEPGCDNLFDHKIVQELSVGDASVVTIN